jgi:phage terminase large subunit-like protein
VVVANTNAGFVDSWQYKTREAIRSDAAWYFARLDGPVASWITQDRLAEQRRLLPAWQFARLWLNEWTSGVDNPLVSEDDLASAITLPGPMEAFDPERGPYIAGLDIGTRSDRTALVVLGLNLRGPRVQLAAVREWDPSRYGGTLPLSVVERDIVEIAQNAKLHGIVYDPTEAVMLAERLTARGIPMFRYAWSAQKKEKMALYALESFHHRKIDLFDCPALLRDLRRTQVAERAGHMTFTQARDEHGHCDVGSAFLMALTWARVTRADYLGSYDGLPDVGEAA